MFKGVYKVKTITHDMCRIGHVACAEFFSVGDHHSYRSYQTGPGTVPDEQPPRVNVGDAPTG